MKGMEMMMKAFGFDAKAIQQIGEFGRQKLIEFETRLKTIEANQQKIIELVERK